MRAYLAMLTFAVVVAALSEPTFAAHQSGQARIESGQTEITKNLKYHPPHAKADRRYFIHYYSITASPANALAYTFVVTRIDGSVDTFAASEGEHRDGRFFTGRGLDLKIRRISNDVSKPITILIRLGTSTEGEVGFPKP